MARPPAVRGVARALAAGEARLEAMRERRSAEHRALLAAARRVFLARGYSQTRVEDILEEAAISTRAFYRFHASKDELFLELFGQANEAAMRRLGEAVGRESAAPRQLDAYIEAMLDLAYTPRYRAETRLFASVPAELAHRYAREIRACREQLVAGLRQIVTSGRDSGAFPAADPEEDAWALHGILSGAQERVLLSDQPPPRERMSQHLRRFCQAALIGQGIDKAIDLERPQTLRRQTHRRR